MDLKARKVLLSFVVMSVVIGQYPSDAVSVTPSLCPTNKIAPQRRLNSWERHRPRTFGSFYDLFSNGDLQQDSLSSLQEDPQEDDSEDCGDIEDYDEADLSSITPQAQRKGGSRETRTFLHHFFNPNQGSQGPYPAQGPGHPNNQGGNPNQGGNYPNQGGNYPNQGGNYPNQGGNYPNQGGNYPNQGGNYPNQGGNYPGQVGPYPNQGGPNYPNQGGNYPNRPQRPDPTRYPVRPTPPTPFRPQKPGYPPPRPPYSSGGVFSDNPYRPPYQQTPSDRLKPVYEGTPEPSATYRPGVVGGPVGHIAGHSSALARPTPPVHVDDVQHNRRPNQVVFERPDTDTARPRSYNNSGLLGSFFDLFFK